MMPRLSSVIRQLTTLTITCTAIVCTTVTIASPLTRLSYAVTLAHTPKADQLACFASNPDIGGIGVRVSTYTQSFLFTFSCVAGGLKSQDRKALEKTNLLITACVLLICAFIEAITHQLSFYHALLVLDWSWVLTLNALLLIILPTIDGQIGMEWSKMFHSSLPSQTSQIRDLTFVSLHMSLMGAFGVYVWSHPDRLQGPKTGTSFDSAACLRNTVTYIFFARFRASNPTLRRISIVCYIFVALPFVNVFLLTGTTVVIVNVANALICKPYTFGRIYRITWLVQTAINVGLIINTELTITKNNNVIASGESTWGFGQIFAVLLIFSPLLEALSVINDKLRRSTRGWASYQFQRFLRENEDSWEIVYSEEIKQINDLVATLESLNEAFDLPALRTITSTLKNARDFFDAANMNLKSRPEEQEHPSLNTLDNTTAAARDGISAQQHPQGPFAAPGTSLTAPDSATVQDISAGQTPASGTDTTALKRDLINLRERMSKICQVRFPVSNAESFLASKAYLRATEEALGVAIVALEPLE